MPKKVKKPTAASKARNWAAVHAHFRRSGVTDKESQEGKCKRGWNNGKERRKSKANLRKYRY